MMNRNMEARDERVDESKKTGSYNTELLIGYMEIRGSLPMVTPTDDKEKINHQRLPCIDQLTDFS